MVLTVSSPAPDGAPNPNGAEGVTLKELGSVDVKSQFWKAIQITGEGGKHLRSAGSYETNTNTDSSVQSALVGWGASKVALDLGYNTHTEGDLQGAYTGNFWDQSGASNQSGASVDNSQFQQWTYDTTTKQLTNVYTGYQLVYDSTSNTVVTQAVSSSSPIDPNSQWYAYPDYFLNNVVDQQACNPPFPDWTTGSMPTTDSTTGTTYNCGLTTTADDEAGATAAYTFFSQQILGSGVNPTCTIGTASYAGIRCEYTNLAAATLQTCATTALSPSDVETNYAGSTPISANDWAVVTNQLRWECQYAADVQTLFSNYYTILNTVATDSSANLPALAEDVSLPVTTTSSWSWETLLEGILYTALNIAGAAVGDPKAGSQLSKIAKAAKCCAAATANLMETGMNTQMSASSSTTNQQKPITQTIADIFGAISTDLRGMTDNTSSGENLILEDWGKLQLIGPRTETDGYNGLALQAGALGALETSMEYSIDQQMLAMLMSTNYAMHLNVARTSQTPGFSFTDWSNEMADVDSANNSATPNWYNLDWNYPTFGSDTGSYNAGEFNSSSGIPQQAAYDDLNKYGADPFEFINGINRWANAVLNLDNIGCGEVITTIFNATPRGYLVTVTPQAGVLAVPGTDFTPTNGSEGAYSFELRPYGYLPIYTSANYDWRTGHDSNLAMNVSINETFNGNNVAASFSFGANGCASGYTSTIEYSNVVQNYSYYFGSWNTHTQAPANGNQEAQQGGVWVTLHNDTIQQ